MCHDKFWDSERIEWYERAAMVSRYHDCLADEIEKYISKEQAVLEIGAGLGHVAEILARRGYRIKATDNDADAIERAKERSHLDIFSCLDASLPLPSSDVLLMIQFGHITKGRNLEHYLANTGKIIYVASSHRNRDTREETREFLGKRGLLSDERSFDLDFSQPLQNKSDAMRFLERFNHSDLIDSCLEREDGSLLFPTKKHLTIFIIERKNQ